MFQFFITAACFDHRGIYLNQVYPIVNKGLLFQQQINELGGPISYECRIQQYCLMILHLMFRSLI